MSAIFVFQTAIEILMALFVLWCFINEKKLIRFEQRLKASILRKYRLKRQKKLQLQRLRLLEKSVYRPEIPCDDPLYVA